MSNDAEMSSAKRAYEAKRAAKAGKSLDAWLKAKEKRVDMSAKPIVPAAPKKPGLISRLLDRAHKPL